LAIFFYSKVFAFLNLAKYGLGYILGDKKTHLVTLIRMLPESPSGPASQFVN
jgi:hypothetical protein